MAGNGTKAWEFVNDLRARCEVAFSAESRELQNFAAESGGHGGEALAPWDVYYFAEKLRQRECAFEEEHIRPYFEVGAVLKGAFATATRLYGVKFVRDESLSVWHESVSAYQLLNARDEILAWFYVDIFPRESKRGGAWMQGLATGTKRGDERTPHLALMAGNVTAAGPDSPGLLTLREVETVFHEFGHLMHQCLSEVDIRSLGGTNVAWDFVELPSQIMENWVWERESLDAFAHHVDTGENIPDDLFQAMCRARKFRAATDMMRQLSFATMDLALHTRYNADRDGELLEYCRTVVQPLVPSPLPDYYAMVAGFSHLFSSPVGYAAGYYSYKWAEVLEADAFEVFLTEGIFSPEVGERFRSIILSRGNTQDAIELFHEFAGGEPDPAALLVRMGLAA